MIQLTEDIIAVEVPNLNTSDYHFKYDSYFEILYLKYSLIGVNNKVCELKEVEVPLNSKQIIGVTPLSYEDWCIQVFFNEYDNGNITHGDDIAILLESKGLDINKNYAIIKIEK